MLEKKVFSKQDFREKWLKPFNIKKYPTIARGLNPGL
jgi:hypothetical protein